MRARLLPFTPSPLWLLALFLSCCAAFASDDARPVVGPGATKEDVIKAYGWPNGQSQSGTKEILSYSQGEVILENGRVERVNFSPNVPWQKPKPRPGPPTASTRKVPEKPVDFWLTDFDEAREEAQRRRMRVLALFTGSDWSPASRQFTQEVEFHPDFINAFAGDFVFLKLDYPRGNPVPVTLSDELVRIRDLYDVTTYPSLLILSANGELLSRVDLTRNDGSTSFRERVIAAVRHARDLLPRANRGTPAAEPPAQSAPAALSPATVASPDPATTSTGTAVSPATPALLSAGRILAGALVVGGALVLFLLWRMWRAPRVPQTGEVIELADRIDAAAGGMPSAAEISGWSKHKLCAVTAGLAEFDNYVAQLRPPGEDVDIELRRRGDTKPRVLVHCSPASAGVVPTKRLRELFGSLAAEGAEAGWFVSPAGFTGDARQYADAHRIVLLTTEGLHNMMREVPPVSLPAVLARGEREE